MFLKLKGGSDAVLRDCVVRDSKSSVDVTEGSTAYTRPTDPLLSEFSPQVRGGSDAVLRDRGEQVSTGPAN